MANNAFQIYLAGGMQNLSFEEQNEWREIFMTKVRLKVEAQIDCACDVSIPSVRFINPVQYYNFKNPVHGTEKEIMNFDTRLVRNSDLIVVNANDPHSVGTSMEIAIAHEHNIPVLILAENDEELHPWWVEMADKIFDNINDMYDYILRFYLVHDDYIEQY